MGIEALARPEILAMKPYSSARKEAPGEGILLNANESPWPLIEGVNSLNRYPEPQPARLLSKLSKLYDIAEDNILITRGSDEGIDLLTRVFCRAGKDAILQCPPTFGMYKIAAQTQGAEVVSVARRPQDGLQLDQQAVLDTLAADSRVKLVFLTSPNNPTGDVVDPDFLRSLLEAARDRAVVVLDEAYAEFCDQPSAIPLISEFENLAILRTLSKAWASAGLRCGAVIAQQAVIDLLRRVIAPYPLPSPVVDLALQMLRREVLEKQRESLARLKSNKEFLLNSLQGLSFIDEILPGEANFVLIHTARDDELLQFCADRGVVIRGFPADPLLSGWLRISIGSKRDLGALLGIFEEWEANS